MAEAPRYLRQQGARNGSLVLVDTVQNYIWHRNGPNGVYRCALYESHFCRARLVFRDGRYVPTGQPHSHEEQERQVIENRMVAWAQRRAEQEAVPVLNIFRDAQNR